MRLNIKDDETRQLIRELARLTGESQTMAVTVAVRERLDRLRSAQPTSLAEQLLAIGKDTARRLREPFQSAEHGDVLYGGNGLPA